MNSIKEQLTGKGINPSFHRLKIYENLHNRKDHPTADMIFNDLIGTIPTLSKTTVYNTLKILSNNGLALPIRIDESELRFDADTSFHGHLHCSACNTIVDLDLDDNLVTKLTDIKDHLIEECHVYLRGTCKKCLQ